MSSDEVQMNERRVTDDGVLIVNAEDAPRIVFFVKLSLFLRGFDFDFLFEGGRGRRWLRVAGIVVAASAGCAYFHFLNVEVKYCVNFHLFCEVGLFRC